MRSIAVPCPSRCCRRSTRRRRACSVRRPRIENGFALDRRRRHDRCRAHRSAGRDTGDDRLVVRLAQRQPGTLQALASAGARARRVAVAATAGKPRPRALYRSNVDRRRVYRQHVDPRGHPLRAARKLGLCRPEPRRRAGTGHHGVRAHRAWRCPHRCRLPGAPRAPDRGRQRDAFAFLDRRALCGRPEQCARNSHGAGGASLHARRPRPTRAPSWSIAPRKCSIWRDFYRLSMRNSGSTTGRSQFAAWLAFLRARQRPRSWIFQNGALR